MVRRAWYKRTFLSVNRHGTKSFFPEPLVCSYAIPLSVPMTNNANLTPAGIVLFERGRHGSRERLIRNLYAYRVAALLAGGEGICPACMESFYVDNDGNVDRTYKRDNYVTGEIVYLCGDCNQSRNNGDWPDVEGYRAAVLDAGARVAVPSAREASEWWKARPRKAPKVRRWG